MAAISNFIFATRPILAAKTEKPAPYVFLSNCSIFLEKDDGARAFLVGSFKAAGLTDAVDPTFADFKIGTIREASADWGKSHTNPETRPKMATLMGHAKGTASKF